MRAQLPAGNAGEAGFTLIETIVVMAILSFVLLGLTDGFVSGLRSESVVYARQRTQENARLALTRMREDIHCADALAGLEQNAYGGFTLTLTQTNNVCPSVVSSSNPDDTSQVALQWCTIPDASNPGTFDLYRKAGSCDGTNSSLLVDSIVAPSAGWPQNSSVSATAWDGNIWPTSRTCSSGSAPTVAVDLNVNPSPTTKSQQAYELQDEIALRNASRCS